MGARVLMEWILIVIAIASASFLLATFAIDLYDFFRGHKRK